MRKHWKMEHLWSESWWERHGPLASPDPFLWQPIYALRATCKVDFGKHWHCSCEGPQRYCFPKGMEVRQMLSACGEPSLRAPMGFARNMSTQIHCQGEQDRMHGESRPCFVFGGTQYGTRRKSLRMESTFM